MSLIPPIRLSALERHALLTISISFDGEIMSPCSRCAKKGVTATQSIEGPSTVIQRAHACAIGLSMDSDIKMRSRRRRWKKGHVYIHMPRLKRAP